ncbi:PREDICTED: protein Jade-1-like [Amphimedon queenslandica]|uniref:PHD-type domain-containing protein n=1 Tax=Amphimedon queenslandica TaxID=400682 RepID=A0AAN0JJA9_AMPQE|nr:PREDICTED: protein Jade-1-like [Amphimedon queenslandica]|eukprot:XP_019856876.1 PREDICTED: protein Jade-1-like [Amphimedon queenslandica]
MSSGYHHRFMSTGGGPTGQSTSSSSRTAELFRSDLITAMKLPDSHYLDSSNYVEIRDQWRSEWEVGVQVCVSPESIPQSSVRQSSLEEVREEQKFARPDEFFSDEVNSQLTQDEVLLKGTYEIDELDQAWLQLVNEKRKYKILAGSNGITEKLLKSSIMTLEKKCYYNMIKALATEESLRIEYDQSIVCDVCKDPEREEANEMIFCDSCNVCVHQACYGVQLIPKGSWLCRPCTSQQSRPFQCLLCPNKNGAMKRVKPGNGWAHMSCALWIPEVKIANIDKMEPITNIDSIPVSRWNLMCCICRERNGACIQCSYPTCVSSYHAHNFT